MFRILIPRPVCHRILSRSFSRLCHQQQKNLVLSKSEFRAWRNLFHRSNFLKISSAPNFSTSSSKAERKGQESGASNEDEEDDPEKEKRNAEMKFFGAISAVALIVFLFLPNMGRNEDQMGNNQDVAKSGTTTYNEFFHTMLQAGEVQEIVIAPALNRAIIMLRPNAIIKGQRARYQQYHLQYSPGLDMEHKIREFEAQMGIPAGGGIPIKYARQGETFGSIFSALIVITLLGLIFRAVSKNVKSMGSINPLESMTKAPFTLINPKLKKNQGVKFSDVAGLKEAKTEVKEFVDYLKNPQKYKELGAKPPKGAIMFGPPGCGKTMLAKAVANESEVPFLSMNGSEFIEMIGGLGASRVRSLFKEARKRAPAIIFIDEIDAIGRKRSEGAGGFSPQNSEGEQTLNQLLVEMDGLGTNAGDIVMLASTNRADVLDKALLRPGRFDRQITIDLPTVIERKEILEQHMKGVTLSESPEIFSERLATLTPGFSGADLANLINEAALHAARVKHSSVTKEDLEYAIERVIAGPEKKTNVLQSSERNIVAYHESGHALVGWMLKHTDALLKVTIIPRTSMALGFAQYTPIDKKLYSPEEYLDRMCMALGGRVAESLTFNRITTGAQNDLEKVTKMAYSQIKYFGFNDKIGYLSFEDQDPNQRKPYSKKLQATMDQEAREMIAEAYKRTEQILKEHQNSLEILAQALLEKETLNYDDVEQLLGPPPFGKKHLVSPVEYEQSLDTQADLGSKGKTSGV